MTPTFESALSIIAANDALKPFPDPDPSVCHRNPPCLQTWVCRIIRCLWRYMHNNTVTEDCCCEMPFCAACDLGNISAALLSVEDMAALASANHACRGIITPYLSQVRLAVIEYTSHIRLSTLVIRCEDSKHYKFDTSDNVFEIFPCRGFCCLHTDSCQQSLGILEFIEDLPRAAYQSYAAESQQDDLSENNLELLANSLVTFGCISTGLSLPSWRAITRIDASWTDGRITVSKITAPVPLICYLLGFIITPPKIDGIYPHIPESDVPAVIVSIIDANGVVQSSTAINGVVRDPGVPLPWHFQNYTLTEPMLVPYGCKCRIQFANPTIHGKYRVEYINTRMSEPSTPQIERLMRSGRATMQTIERLVNKH